MEAHKGLDFRILGPFEVWQGEERLELGARKQRALLAVLLLHRGEAVSTDRLIDELWGERAPQAATKSVQVYVSGLRKALGESAVQTRERGYALELQADQLDAQRFERLLEEARGRLDGGDAGGAAKTLREALDLWRGPPLAEFAYEEFAQTEVARLEELRLAALEERIEADLAAGRHGELVPELEAMVREHPLRERPRAQLMLALYRSGRQADALEAYRQARQALVEVGLEPGRELQELEQAILRQDPDLDAQPRRRLPALAERRRRGSLLIIGSAALLLAAAVAAAIVELDGGGEEAEFPVRGNSVAAIDPETNRVVADVPVGSMPSSIAVGEGAVWVLNADDRTIAKVDPSRERVQKAFAIGGDPTDLAVGGGAVWIGRGKPAAASQVFGTLVPAALTRVDSESTAVAARVRLPAGPSGVGGRFAGQRQIAVGRETVWAVGSDGAVARIDARTNRLVGRIPRLLASSLALDGEQLWAVGGEGTVTRIDARSNKVRDKVELATISLTGIATGAGAVWATDPFAGSLWRIDPGPPAVARTIPVGAGAYSVAVGAGAVWVVNSLDSTVLRVDPESNRVVARISVPGTPREVAVGGGRVWVSVAPGSGASEPVAGAPRDKIAGALPASVCGSVSYGGSGSPELMIVSNLPLKGEFRGTTRPEAQAIEFVLARHHFLAGRYSVGYQSCDDSATEEIGEDPDRCIANAGTFAATRKVVGVIGPFTSGCAAEQIPILNRAPGGPVAMLSLSNSDPSLTQTGPGDFERLYPTGIRNYARLSPTDDYQGAAHALLAQSLRLKRLFVLTAESQPYGNVLTEAFRRAARRLGLGLVGTASWGPEAPSYGGLVRRIRRARPDGIFLAGAVFDNAGPLVKELRAVLGPEVKLFAPDGFSFIPFLRRVAGRAAKGMYVSLLGRPNSALGATGRSFLEASTPTQPGGLVPSYSATYAAQAAEILLAAIERSDGTRASVSRELLRTEVEDGILGTFRFDRNGDTTLNPITILRVIENRDVSPTLLADQVGTVIEKVISPPASLLRDG